MRRECVAVGTSPVGDSDCKLSQNSNDVQNLPAYWRSKRHRTRQERKRRSICIRPSRKVTSSSSERDSLSVHCGRQQKSIQIHSTAGFSRKYSLMILNFCPHGSGCPGRSQRWVTTKSLLDSVYGALDKLIVLSSSQSFHKELFNKS